MEQQAFNRHEGVSINAHGLTCLLKCLTLPCVRVACARAQAHVQQLQAKQGLVGTRAGRHMVGACHPA